MDVSDLIGIPYVRDGRDQRQAPFGQGGLDCWGLCRVVLSRLGVHWPELPDDAIMSERELAVTCHEGAGVHVGDVLVLPGDGGNPPHRETLSDGLGQGMGVGVCINARQFITTVPRNGSHLANISAYRTAGAIVRRVRPRGLL